MQTRLIQNIRYKHSNRFKTYKERFKYIKSNDKKQRENRIKLIILIITLDSLHREKFILYRNSDFNSDY